MTINTILFDMDGVLLDAVEWHFLAFNEAVSYFGEELTETEHNEKYNGLPTAKKLELLTKERGFPAELYDFVQFIKQKSTNKMIETYAKPYFPHEYCLSNLKNKGFALGLCSNSKRNTVEVAMERVFLKQYFDVILSNEDVSNPKPDPEIYLKAMNLLNVSNKNVLILEDNINGITAARSSGANVMEIKSPTDVNYLNVIAQIERYK
jgi:beta-phosphoglucomutase